MVFNSFVNQFYFKRPYTNMGKKTTVFVFFLLLIFVSWATSCPVIITVSGYESWTYCSAPFSCVTLASPPNSFCAQEKGFSIKVASGGYTCSAKCYSSDSIYISTDGSATYRNSKNEPTQMGLISSQGSCQKFSYGVNGETLMVQVCTNTTA